MRLHGSAVTQKVNQIVQIVPVWHLAGFSLHIGPAHGLFPSGAYPHEGVCRLPLQHQQQQSVTVSHHAMFALLA